MSCIQPEAINRWVGRRVESTEGIIHAVVGLVWSGLGWFALVENARTVACIHYNNFLASRPLVPPLWHTFFWLTDLHPLLTLVHC